jgi:hypothetical protein
MGAHLHAGADGARGDVEVLQVAETRRLPESGTLGHLRNGLYVRKEWMRSMRHGRSIG